MNALLVLLLASAGSFPGFVPPPGGTGDEILPLGPRSYAMGGICAGIRDTTTVSILNPAASAWTGVTGIGFAGMYGDGDVPARDGVLGFPEVSAQMALPLGLRLQGALDGRSRVSEDAGMAFEDYAGELEWRGGLTETYLGLSLIASDWLAVSLGGRATSGSIVSDVVLTEPDPEPPVPVNTVYRDDATFEQAWGAVAGLSARLGPVGLGFSVTTDRSADIRVLRDYSGTGEDTTTIDYTVPGELTTGLSLRPHPRVLLGVDLFARKALNIAGNRMDGGTVLSAGTEVLLPAGLSARAGYNRVSGLWRDGANAFTLGAGYVFGGGSAGLDVAVGYQYWTEEGDDREETTVYLGLWTSERWLGD